METKWRELPKPSFSGNMSIEEVLASRRTIRNFAEGHIELKTVSQLLWALQGITQKGNAEREEDSFRTAPSAGRSYPLVVYLLYGDLWIYQPEEHALTLHKREDLRKTLAEAVLTRMNREAIEVAPLTVVVASDSKSIVELTPRVEDALCFTYLEAGHATQNLILQAWALGLGACTITSYKTAKAQRLLALPLHHRPIYLIPLGIPNNQTSASNEL